MEPERPHLSITLPRNFMFHYRDGPAPRTPEPESQPEELQPPPPPRQVMKVRRRRTTLVMDHDFLQDVSNEKPIPTIEMPELHSDMCMDLPSIHSPQDDSYLMPGVGYTRAFSPPKTPAAQVRTISHYEGPQHWAEIERASQSETSSRPTSSSGFSDSSISSCDSIGSFMSRGGNCTSPEEEMNSPLMYFSPAIDQDGPMSPLATYEEPRPAKKLKLRATFSEEMDHHLWMTYMKYLQDPTVTPFKALPSTVPPNGVCHRVARMARKTWKGPRSSRNGALRAMVQSASASRSDTPDTIKPTRSGSSTPIARASKSLTRYPSEKQCRKRLRDLAKQKPTLSAHYQRLLQRSPSPFQSSPPAESTTDSRPLSSPFSQGSTSFTTRDMNLSLATSTAPSMQLGNPLSQLANNVPARQVDRPWSSLRASAHQKSQSLHIGLGLGLGNGTRSPLLRAREANEANRVSNNAQTWHAPSSSVQPTRLGSPFQLHAPRPISRVFKRRALQTFEDKARSRGDNFVNEVFGAPAESSHRRVRSRGFSLGDTMEGARRLPLANDPSGFNPFAGLAPTIPNPAQRSPAVMADVQGRITARLGSPFAGRSSNTFPRGATSHSFEPPASFEQRFAAMPSDSTYLRRS